MPNFWYNFMVVESPKRLPKFVFLFLKKSIVISVILTTGTTLFFPLFSYANTNTVSEVISTKIAAVQDSYASAFASTKNSYASALAVIDTTSFSISLPTISIPTLPTLALPTISVPTPPTLSLPTLDLPNPTAVVADSYATAFASTKNSYASAFETIPTLALPTLSLPNPTAVVADS